MSSSSLLRFDDGAVQFRLRLVVALLSHRSILIRNIRSDDLESPGLRDYEVSFLRLLDTLTNGTRMEINTTGTQLRFQPGVLIGSDMDTIQHECPTSRGIGWFLEGILPLAPFGKEPLRITFTGVTEGTCQTDPSPDYIQSSVLPLFEKFGIGTDQDESPPPHIRVVSRAAAATTTREGVSAGGGGRVEFYCPIVKELQPIDLLDAGLVKRIRGKAISCRIPPSSSGRVAHAAKGLLQRLLPDIWIHTDVHNKKSSASLSSPSLSLVLRAESTTGCVWTSECCMDATQARGAELPEDLGQRGAAMLLEEIKRGGCIDTTAQSFVLLLMCLGPEDVARIRIGTLSQYTIASLRLFKQALGVEFKAKPDHDSKTVLLSCLGTGYRNMAKAST